MPHVYVLRHHPSALHKAQRALASMPGWTLAGAGTHGRLAAEDIVRTRPDILACDLRLADGPATRLESALRGMDEPPLVLLFADSPDELGMFDALRSIGNGYAVEGGRTQGLIGALRRLASGRASMSPQLAQQTLALAALGRTRLADAQLPAAARDYGQAGGLLGFTRADQHLLSLLAHGLLVGEVAARWRVGEVEIERRIHALYQRLHGSARAAAQAAA
ncbi:MAG: response regulator transcription factor [Pelomonas sp.]|nr:response regulator transcription factor [Roseateles sp.]